MCEKLTPDSCLIELSQLSLGPSLCLCCSHHDTQELQIIRSFACAPYAPDLRGEYRSGCNHWLDQGRLVRKAVLSRSALQLTEAISSVSFES